MWEKTQCLSGNVDHSPTEDAKDEIEHEEGADDDERDKVDPVEEAPQSIVSLIDRKRFATIFGWIS